MLEKLYNRYSIPPKFFSNQKISKNDLNDILKAARSTPDHGKLYPWKFLIIEDDKRERLGNIFADALIQRDPTVTEALIKKEKSRPLRAQTIVTIIADIVENNPKVPPVEQICSAAMAVQNMLLAAHIKQIGSILLTGKNAHDNYVKEKLGLMEKDVIIGFLYLGYVDQPINIPSKRPNINNFVSYMA